MDTHNELDLPITDFKGEVSFKQTWDLIAGLIYTNGPYPDPIKKLIRWCNVNPDTTFVKTEQGDVSMTVSLETACRAYRFMEKIDAEDRALEYPYASEQAQTLFDRILDGETFRTVRIAAEADVASICSLPLSFPIPSRVHFV
jgi:hypothetical protein